MKTTVLKIAIFICLVGVVVTLLKRFVLDPAVVAFEGETTSERIERAFAGIKAEAFDCLVLGNSRAYRGVNPDKMTSCRAFNFAHDADSFNQTFYKLQYVLARRTVATAIISLDYFDFGFIEDRRNKYYRKYFPAEYFRDYQTHFSFDDLITFLKKMNQSWNILATNEFLVPTKSALAVGTYLVSDQPFPESSFQKSNGQYVKLPLRHGDPLDWADREKEAIILDIQKAYFVRLIELARANNVRLVFFTAPCREEELGSYKPSTLKTLRDQFYQWSKEYGFAYLD